MLTVGITYYNNKENLDYVISYYTGLNTGFKFIVVDDGSDIPLESDDVPDDWGLYRVLDDIGFNNEGCRNLIGNHCKTKYIALIDIDRVLREGIINKILYTSLLEDLEYGYIYCCDYMNQFITHSDFFNSIQYDLTFPGLYGLDSTFLKKTKSSFIPRKEMLKDLHFYYSTINQESKDYQWDILVKIREKTKWYERALHNPKINFEWVCIKS